MKLFFWRRKKSKIIKTLDICAPCDGLLVDHAEICDQTITGGTFGKGLTILPAYSDVYSPINGDISLVFNTKNAFLLRSQESEISVLLYVGQTNIPVDDEGYEYKNHRNPKQPIKVGNLLCSFFLTKGNRRDWKEYVSVLVQDENMEGRAIIFHRKAGKVKRGELLMQVVPESTPVI